MSYAVVISPEAAAQMQSLAAPLPAFISAQLDRR
jgi:hypothetical protein